MCEDIGSGEDWILFWFSLIVVELFISSNCQISGGLLLSCGYQVQFIGRERILKEVQDAEGFYCTDIKGGEIYNPISRVDCREDYEIQFDDIIIIAVKNTALDSVARELSQKLKNVAENSVTLVLLFPLQIISIPYFISKIINL